MFNISDLSIGLESTETEQPNIFPLKDTFLDSTAGNFSDMLPRKNIVEKLKFS